MPAIAFAANLMGVPTVAGRLEGKVALITAAGQGIGHATALAMAREGARVYATDVNAKALERYADTPGIITRALDVLDDAAVEKTIADLPPLSILFNCAGYVHNGTVLDFVPKGIRCNAIAPGTVDTPSLHERINAQADPVEARKAFIARQPMGRLAKPEEIAPIVVFLASDESAFATGNVYPVDGGMTI